VERWTTREDNQTNLGRIYHGTLERDSAECLDSTAVRPVTLLRGAFAILQCDPESNPGVNGKRREDVRESGIVRS
jgi:hypothetical protein